MIVSPSSQKIICACYNGRINIYDTKSGSLLNELDGHYGSIDTTIKEINYVLTPLASKIKKNY